jgi:hypothetical protein
MWMKRASELPPREHEHTDTQSRQSVSATEIAIKISVALPRSWILDRLGCHGWVSGGRALFGGAGNQAPPTEQNRPWRSWRYLAPPLARFVLVRSHPWPRVFRLSRAHLSPKRSPSRLSKLHLADNQAMLVPPPLETRSGRAEVQCRLPKGRVD